MKSTLLLIVGLLLAGKSWSQKIDGVGPFKINKTTVADLMAIAKSKGYRVSKITTRDEGLEDKAPGLYQLIANRTDPDDSPGFCSFCPTSKVYWLPLIRIAGIDVANIYLIFSNNVLVHFTSDSSVFLTEALNTKYGNAPVKMEDGIAVCDGDTLKTQSFTSTWQKNIVEFEESSYTYYDPGCIKRLTSTLHISDLIKSDREFKCHMSNRKVLFKNARKVNDPLKDL